ncbi:MAG: tetratricopeptide repeat protein [Cyanophyceae cyanobacterium]
MVRKTPSPQLRQEGLPRRRHTLAGQTLTATVVSLLLSGGLLFSGDSILNPTKAQAQASAGNPVSSDPPLQDIVTLVMEAIAATEVQDWAKAVDFYRQAVELEPSNSGLYNNWGVVLRRYGDVAGSIRAYQRALELDPTLDTVYVNLGLALLVEQRWQEALETLTQAEERLPDEITVPLYRGIALENLGQWREATQAYNAYVQRDPNALGHYRLAVAHWQMGDPQRASEFFQRAARLETQVGLYSAEAGRSLALLGQYQDAVLLLERLPDTWMEEDDFLILARIAYHLNRTDLADRALRRALALAGSDPSALVKPGLLNDAGILAGEQQDLVQAVAFLESAVGGAAQQPAADLSTLAVVNANLADLYLAQGRIPEALQRAQVAVREDPTLAQAHNTVAVILFEQEQLLDAIQAWEEATRLDPNYWQALRNLAIAYAVDGQTDRGIATMQVAMTKAPTLDIVQQLNGELQRIPDVEQKVSIEPGND